MNEKEEVMQVVRVDDKDWFLQNLINIVNSDKMSFGITLNVSGFLVSGTLIGGKQYFEGFGAAFASGFQDEAVKASITEAFASNGDVYTSTDTPQHPPSYIHLKEARFFHTNGNPIPGNSGVWWRGRISEVSGFSLGSLSAEKS